MALRFLIYRTDFGNTIVRESPTDTSTGGTEASFQTDFVIPEIQPLYLWRVNTDASPFVEPNSDANILAWEAHEAPVPTPEDLVNLGDLTGATAQKIDKVTGATAGNVATFVSGGNVQDSGYSISDLTGGTTYTFQGSGGTQVSTSGTNPVNVVIYSTPPTGTTVTWNDVTSKPSWLSGTTLSAFEAGHSHSQYLTNAIFSGYTGTTDLRLQGIENDITYISGVTDTKLNTTVFSNYTGATQPVIDAAVTGATNLGTGQALFTTLLNRNIQLKSLKVLGGLSISSDSTSITISGGSSSVSFADITGPVSGNTNLQNALDAKLNISTFSGYTGTTDLRFQGIENDITYISGITDTKLNTTIFSNYTGATQPVIATALTGATNGLGFSNRVVELGGSLTKNTLIDGTTFNLSANTKSITLQAINGINIIDTDGVGGINIESDGGTISLIGFTNLGVEKTKLEINDTQMLITDSRTTPVGLQYNTDYSTSFTNESLITKRYADAIAAGLVPKEAVLVATTAPVVLSGLSTVDGILLTNGDRVLVKDQASAIDNGIYVASGNTWSRAADFDDIPSVEVTSGNIIPVVSGSSNHNTLWVLITPNPVVVGSDPLNFTLFASPMSYIAGHGIDITGNTIFVKGTDLDSTSISYTGGTFNVILTSGPVKSALDGKENTITGAATTITTSNLTASRALVSDGSGKVAVSNITSTELGYLSGTTSNIQSQLNSKQATITGGATSIVSSNLTINRALISDGSGKVAVSPVLNTELAYLTGATSNIQTQLNSKLNTSVFAAYTGSTVNKDKKIQVVSTATDDVNGIGDTAVLWSSANPYATDIYAYSAGTSTVQILSGGTFEVQYHVTLKNSASNQTHSVGAYVLLTTGATTVTIPLTATAAMIVGPNTSGELSLPPVVLTIPTNGKLDLVAFRIGNAGTVNLVSGSVYMVINKLT